MGSTRIIVVMLRQPKSDPTESRTDPLYEFGCFGLTGCHSANLLRDDVAEGARLAFAQGGPGEVRLAYVTPPVRVSTHGTVRSCDWTPREMPLKYENAPLLVDNTGRSEVDGLQALIKHAACPTWVSRFSSCFRSRKQALPPDVAEGFLGAWEAHAQEPRAKWYWEALPRPPPMKDPDRQATYESLRQRAMGELYEPPAQHRTAHPATTCSPKRKRC